MFQYLDAALDLGLMERDFWEMSLAELNRFFKSRKRLEETKQKTRASFDYILADLIGRSNARLYSSSAKYPQITDIYPTLFDVEQIRASKAEKDRQRFIAGLQQYATTHNNSIEG